MDDLFLQNRKQTQKAKILEYMKQGNSLTPLDALQKFSCFRLGARIYELKRMGYQIQSEMIKTDTGKYIKKYWIGGKNGE